MKTIFFVLFISNNFLFSQQNDIETLKLEKSKVENIISLYNDSLKVINKNIHRFEQEYFQNALKENPIILYSVKGGHLKDAPAIEANIIYKLPLGTKLIVLFEHETYYEVKTIFGKGFISSAWVLTTQPVKSSENVRANSIKKSTTKSKRNYSSSKRKSIYRSYYRGPRGGCYYINSNGKKTYVSRSMCN